MADVENLVYQTSATTGTGNFTLISTTGYRAFSDAFPSSNSTSRFYYSIRHQSANEYEIGEGYLSSGALVRHTVLQSSNSNNLVNFTSGTKDVINDIPASLQEQLVTLTADLAGKASSSHTHAISDVTGLQTALDGKVDENASITGATKTKITYDAKGLVTAGADATTADIADSTNKRYVTDAQLTVIGNTSGTNTGDQSIFKTISVSGQSDVVADSATDTLTLAAGSNITITTNASTDTITIAASGGSGSPAGSDTYVQFNDGGSFGADSGLTYNKTTDVLTVTGRVDTPVLRAQSSAGILLESNSGTDIALMGAGGGAGVTFYDGVIYNANTANTLAYHNGSKALSSASTGNTASIDMSLSSGTLSALFTGVVVGKLVLSGSEQITVDTDMDLSPNDVSQIELMPDADNYLIWGIRAYGDRRFIVLENGHEMFNVILEHDSLSSTERRFYCPNNTNYTIEPRASVIVIEDPEAGIWRVISHSQPTIPSPSNSFETIAVSGQSDVVADSATDTLTLVAGSNITITTNAGTDAITISASSGGVSDGDKGDISVTSSGATWTIDNDVVTYAKMQNVSATNRILGRSTAGSGDVEEITVGGDLTQSGSSFTVVSASDTTAGKVELATTAETNTGTDTGRAVTPDGLSGSYAGTKSVSIYAIDAATVVTTGDGKAYFRIPPALNGMNLVGAAAGVYGTSSSGDPTIQIARGRQSGATSAHTFADMLSTKITIDATEYDSKDATTPAVIDGSNDDVATGDLIRVDVDVAGTGTDGLIVTLEFRLP